MSKVVDMFCHLSVLTETPETTFDNPNGWSKELSHAVINISTISILFLIVTVSFMELWHKYSLTPTCDTLEFSMIASPKGH